MPARQEGRIDQGRREQGGRIQNYHVPAHDREGDHAPPPTDTTPATINLSTSVLSLAAPAQATLVATTYNAEARPILPSPTVTWHSSDATKATVSASGVVTAVLAGTTNVTATIGAVTSNTCVVTVDPAAPPPPPPPPPIPVPPDPNSPTPALIFITGPLTVLQIGATQQMTAVVENAAGSKLAVQPSVSWLSTVPSVATIDGNGIVTALASGSTVITANVGSLFSSGFTVSVNATPASIVILPSSAAVQVPNTTQFRAVVKNALGVVLPNVAINSWLSSSPSVATVNGSGLVTSVLAGTTNITASITSPAITSGPAVVTVVDLIPSSIVVAPASASVNVSSTQQMVATVKNVEGSALTQGVDAWHSSSPGVATVNGSGLVTAVAPGSTTITATIASPSLTSNGVTITVPDTVPASITVTPSSATVNTSATQQMTAVVKNAGGATLSTPVSAWQSSAPSKATVNSAGLVTGVAGGTTNITATITSPSLTSNTAVITVQAPADNTPTAIAISPTAPTVALNGTQQFAAVVTNAGGVALNQAVSAWHSSNTNVATINGSGLLTVVAPGTTNVTATITSPAITSNTAAVTVPDTIPASIVVAPTTGIVNAASTLQLTATVKNAAGGTLAQAVSAWHSSNPPIATVNSSGLVTGVAPGLATITATITSPAVTSNGSVISVPATGGGGAGTNYAKTNFEDGTLGPFYNAWGFGMQIVDDPTNTGHGKVLDIHYVNGPPGNVDSNLAIFPTGNVSVAAGQDLWFQGDFYIDSQADVMRKLTYWSATPGTEQMIITLQPGAGAGVQQPMVAIVGPNDNSTYFPPPFITLQAWHRLKWHMRINSAPGVADGVVTVYFDDVQRFTTTTAVWASPGDAAFTFANGGVGYQAQASFQVDEHRYWDNISYASAETALPG